MNKEILQQLDKQMRITIATRDFHLDAGREYAAKLHDGIRAGLARAIQIVEEAANGDGQSAQE